MLRVSVLLPVRDGAPFLARALDSVARQHETGWECLVVDDGSTDASPAIAESYALRDPRFRLMRLPAVGLVRALNEGLAACRGQYVARMDADDVCDPHRLGAQADFLDARPDVVLASCLVRKFPRQSLRVGMLRYERWLNEIIEPEDIAREIFIESPLCHPSVMLPRQYLAQDLGGYQDPPWAEDYDMWLRINQRGHRIAKVPRVLFYWAERPARLSRVSARYGPDAFRACKVTYLARGPLRDKRRVVVWGAGRNGKKFALALQAGGFEVAAFVDKDPRKIGQVIHGAPVVDPPGVLPYRELIVLSAVGQDGARDIVRADLKAFGYDEGRDFWCVA